MKRRLLTIATTKYRTIRKNILYLATLALLGLAVACSKEGEDNIQPTDDEQIQDYTSFVIELEKYRTPLPNVVSGYFDQKGYCLKMYEHGTLLAGYATGERIIAANVDSIYIFSDYLMGIEDTLLAIRYKSPFVVKKYRKNIFNVSENPLAIYVNKQDSLQYPH
ncbi:MAG: hypothetical protein LBL94_01905 [Prevotellaceae bacterium]|nr:hypothetical protein [Prevotellaceae bacterium]